MIPILFTFDMGSELQKPLAVAMITAMIIGTLVSVFIILGLLENLQQRG